MTPHEFWQELLPPGSRGQDARWSDAYPAALPDGRVLHLPLRPLPDGTQGLASLIINQASFAVVDTLAGMLADELRAAAPDVVVGLPTLGLTLASAVAHKLGHGRYVALGTSRKFWYEDGLSAPVSSVTTAAERRLYLDPRLLPLLAGKNVVLIDDVISTGTSIAAGLALLRLVGVEPVRIGAAMLQTERWRERLGADARRVVGVMDSPLFERDGEGWRAVG